MQAVVIVSKSSDSLVGKMEEVERGEVVKRWMEQVANLEKIDRLEVADKAKEVGRINEKGEKS